MKRLYEPLEPYGFNIVAYEGEGIPDGLTDIEPPAILRPKFNFDTQKWEAAPEEPVTPSEMQQIVMQQAKTIVQMQSVMIQQSKDIAELKGVNA